MVESADNFLQRVLQGDRNALGLLLQRFRPWLRQIADREIGEKLAKRVDASDVVQQTCLSAVRNLSDFEGDNETQLKQWLLQIQRMNIQNLVRDHVLVGKRSLNREGTTADVVVLPNLDLPTPSGVAMQGEDSERIRIAMDRLNERQQMVIKGRYLQNLTVEEIATNLDVSLDVVTGLLRRGLLKLKNILAEP